MYTAFVIIYLPDLRLLGLFSPSNARQSLYVHWQQLYEMQTNHFGPWTSKLAGDILCQQYGLDDPLLQRSAIL